MGGDASPMQAMPCFPGQLFSCPAFIQTFGLVHLGMKKAIRQLTDGLQWSAESKGFEPLNRFCRLHAFQACAFDHSANSPIRAFFQRTAKLVIPSHIPKSS